MKVSWDHYSQHMDKSKMFQTTNQLNLAAKHEFQHISTGHKTRNNQMWHTQGSPPPSTVQDWRYTGGFSLGLPLKSLKQSRKRHSETNMETFCVLDAFGTWLTWVKNNIKAAIPAIPTSTNQSHHIPPVDRGIQAFASCATKPARANNEMFCQSRFRINHRSLNLDGF